MALIQPHQSELKCPKPEVYKWYIYIVEKKKYSLFPRCLKSNNEAQVGT